MNETMKQFMLILGMCVGPVQLDAQLFETADARTPFVGHRNALAIGGGRWLMTGTTEFAGSHLLSILNPDGTTAWEHLDPFFMEGDQADIVLMPDSGFLRVGSLDGCDYFPEVSTIERHAADGTLLWDTIINMDFTAEYPLVIIAAATGTTDRIAVAGDSVLLFTLDGDFISRWPSPYVNMNLRAMHWKGDSALIMLSDLSMSIAGSNGTPSVTVAAPAIVKDSHFDGTTLYALTTSAMYFYDADLNFIGSVPLQAGHQALSIMPTDTALYVSSNAGLYQLQGDTLQWLLAWPALPSTQVSGAAIRNNTLMTAASQAIQGFKTGVARTYTLQGDAAVHDEDVEVLLEVDSVWSESPNGQLWNRKAEMTIRLVNHATEVIQKAAVSSWTSAPYVICQLPALHVVLGNLQLQPGDTMVAWTGVHTVELWASPWSGADPAQICVAVMAPNGKVDRDPSDNYTCVSVDFVIGTTELHAPAFTIAPNPATEHCMVHGIRSSDVVHEYSIMDGIGRIVRSGTLLPHGDPSLRIDLVGVTSGCYQLLITGGGMRWSSKLVVSDR